MDRFPDGIGMVLHTEGKLDGVLLRGGEGGPQGPVPQLQHGGTTHRKPITKFEYGHPSRVIIYSVSSTRLHSSVPLLEPGTPRFLVVYKNE